MKHLNLWIILALAQGIQLYAADISGQAGSSPQEQGDIDETIALAKKLEGHGFLVPIVRLLDIAFQHPEQFTQDELHEYANKFRNLKDSPDGQIYAQDHPISYKRALDTANRYAILEEPMEVVEEPSTPTEPTRKRKEPPTEAESSASAQKKRKEASISEDQLKQDAERGDATAMYKLGNLHYQQGQ